MPNEWTWRPELGRWSLETYGLPDRPVPIEVSTRLVERRQGYDFWREIAFTDFVADTRPVEDRQSFRASARGAVWSGADFFHTRSDPVSGFRDRGQAERDGLDSISIGLVLRGTRLAETMGADQEVTAAGAFFVYDARQASRVAWSEHEVMYLAVRRQDVTAALGGEPDAVALRSRLAQSPLRQLLADQFRLMSRHMPSLDWAGRALLLEQTRHSALLALSAPGSAETMSGSALFRAAILYIQAHLAEPGLSAQQVAQALGCSRATLYRAFASSGVGIAETIRDLRLEEVRRGIESSAPDIAVADIAARFGFLDTANFSRQFRSRFGVPPSGIRKRR